jgi:hypothetical protein
MSSIGRIRRILGAVLVVVALLLALAVLATMSQNFRVHLPVEH